MGPSDPQQLRRHHLEELYSNGMAATALRGPEGLEIFKTSRVFGTLESLFKLFRLTILLWGIFMKMIHNFSQVYHNWSKHWEIFIPQIHDYRNGGDSNHLWPFAEFFTSESLSQGNDEPHFEIHLRSSGPSVLMKTRISVWIGSVPTFQPMEWNGFGKIPTNALCKGFFQMQILQLQIILKSLAFSISAFQSPFFWHSLPLKRAWDSRKRALSLNLQGKDPNKNHEDITQLNNTGKKTLPGHLWMFHQFFSFPFRSWN